MTDTSISLSDKYEIQVQPTGESAGYEYSGELRRNDKMIGVAFGPTPEVVEEKLKRYYGWLKDHR